MKHKHNIIHNEKRKMEANEEVKEKKTQEGA
jgi:hypothetical protein